MVGNRPKYPRLTIDTYSRENDLTFSLGKETDHDEIMDLLIDSGCVEAGNILDKISCLRITRNLENGQVFITCSEPAVTDGWVYQLNSLTNTSIRKCHSYTDKELPVKFNFIHPSIDIQKEIVDGFLKKYGQVKEWFPLKDKKYGIPNGQYVFIMREEDL